MGVKSLWTLVTPVGRPVMLETVEGKAMAIDSSIWIYQFQATMRDKEGRGLVNAHVLGFLRRISKLLFYGIKPVFVFDGGAPALKRTTLNERRKKKTGAALSHVKLAEKLLAAQMRREALNHAQESSSANKQKAAVHDRPLDENTVYLEDLEGTAPKTPRKKKAAPSPSSSAKKNKYLDHDPYRLPEVDLEEAVSKATRSAAPDPRLATEEELRTFIEEMRPEDFDVNSPAFRELPTEIQYEIVGDLRLKSRQTSYARLQKMLQTSKTPLDFSKQQIQNLRQRNSLTQQLLTTTDTIGSAHIAIPVRIASERNKEYVLVKNEGADGGWILGIRDTGTREKPITIDHEDEQAMDGDVDSDEEMEEIEVPTAALPDADLRDYQRETALSGISRRQASQRSHVHFTRPINRKTKSSDLFAPIPEDEGLADSDDDDLLSLAVERSLEDSGPTHPRPLGDRHESKHRATSNSYHTLEDGDFYAEGNVPTRLETALSIAGAGPSRLHTSPTKSGAISSLFGKPTLLASPPKENPTTKPLFASPDNTKASLSMEPIPSLFGEATSRLSSTEEPSLSKSLEIDEGTESRPVAAPGKTPFYEPPSTASPPPMQHQQSPMMNISLPDFPSAIDSSEMLPVEILQALSDSDDDMDMEEIPVAVAHARRASVSDEELSRHVCRSIEATPSPLLSTAHSEELGTRAPFPEPLFTAESPRLTALDDDDLIAWSRTPSPTDNMFGSRPQSPSRKEELDPHEMDIEAEEGEFVRFMSQVKGRNMNDIRQEIDDEIKNLNQQRKAAMRDSEDITQQMIAQIMTMLRLFGIPYITAPMEAEAQCAELVSLNLVDGVITDDSDVFLFGGQRVYKNMFNQSKTVECFLLSDLSRELGLDRDTLVQLAYLLGSDYTDGLPGVGPVVAMELLKEFPGRDGLHKFKDWWTKVQSGKDNEDDNRSKFRKQFKKKFKNLYLSTDWPNSIVRDAYYHPTVDSSEEPFKWGMPDLDGLRSFFNQELGWKQNKIDDLLLPIIQRMNKRTQTAALNMQGDLNQFLDISAGSGTHAPRQRQAYASKRLQQVISDFRKRHKSGSVTPVSRSGSRAPSQDDNGGSDSQRDDSGPDLPATKKRKKIATVAGGHKPPGAKVKRGQPSSALSRKRGRGGRTSKGKARIGPSDEDEVVSEGDDGGEFVPSQDVTMGEPTVERDLRPRPKPRPLRRAHTDAQITSGGDAEQPAPDI